MNSGQSIAVAAKKLASTFSGQLLQSADVGYDDARKVYNGLVDKYPALIARSRGVPVRSAATLLGSAPPWARSWA